MLPRSLLSTSRIITKNKRILIYSNSNLNLTPHQKSYLSTIPNNNQDALPRAEHAVISTFGKL